MYGRVCAALIVDYLVEAAPVVLCYKPCYNLLCYNVLCYNLYGRVLLRLPTLCTGVRCYGCLHYVRACVATVAWLRLRPLGVLSRQNL